MDKATFRFGELVCTNCVKAIHFKLFKTEFCVYAQCSSCLKEYLLEGVEDGDCSPIAGRGCGARRCITVFKPVWEDGKEWKCPKCGIRYKAFYHPQGNRWQYLL